jgi:hypothetical protein
MTPTTSLVACILAASVLAAPSAPDASAAPAHPIGRFPVVFHVAGEQGQPVMTAASVADWLDVARAHFAPAGIELAAEVRSLPDGWTVLETFRDRHALKRFLVPRRINVFLVGEILDPVASAATRRAAERAGFEPSGRLAGAHVEAPGRAPDTYILLSARHGSALSLTHELGHFFGVAHHRDPQNIMSYGNRRACFDADQLKTFRARALRHRRRGTLRVTR